MVESNDHSNLDGHNDGHDIVPSDPSEIAGIVLTNKVMLAAYAASIVILAVGLVGIIGLIAWLSFWYPDKANAWLTLVVGPIVGLLILHMKGAESVAKKIIENGHGSK